MDVYGITVRMLCCIGEQYVLFKVKCSSMVAYSIQVSM